MPFCILYVFRLNNFSKMSKFDILFEFQDEQEKVISNKVNDFSMHSTGQNIKMFLNEAVTKFENGSFRVKKVTYLHPRFNKAVDLNDELIIDKEMEIKVTVEKVNIKFSN